MYYVNARDLPGNDVSRTFEGGKHGPCTVSFFRVHNRPGEGPNLHRHAYDETFVILEGNVLVRVGDERIEGGRRLFTVGAVVDGELLAQGKAYNKKDASQIAAQLALDKLGLNKLDTGDDAA